jgi:hydrogenase nickel incorporation protein HypB
MCETCGCSDEKGGFRIVSADHTHDHGDHDHDHLHHHHHHDPDHDHVHHTHEVSRKITVETDILQQNNLRAERNRGYFEAKKIRTLNLVSSPGSGKTTLLEKTVRLLPGKKIYVIEGDQQTSLDAERIKQTGAIALQINTGNGCHLDATMIHKAVEQLDPENNSLLLIENVGNLVCPALFDLGETLRVVIISITEGEDKPLKYPNMFMSSHICVINKMDLMPYLDVDLGLLKSNAKKVNPSLKFIEVSAKTGAGMEGWIRELAG